MPFCVNCGKEIKEGAKFCTNCGKPVVQLKKPEGSEQKPYYGGEIRKCPNCGERIDAFVVNCPSCGYELRGTFAANSLQKLYSDLSKASSTEQKALVIRNFPIPNAKEDIVEFMLSASTNIVGEADKEIFEAWVAKFEQAYHKAQLTLQNDPIFPQIEDTYEKTEKSIAMEKFSHTTAKAGNMVTRYFKAMPNPVFAIVTVLLVILAIIRIFNGQFAGVDILFDAVILGATYGITIMNKKMEQNKAASTAPNTQSNANKIKIPSAVGDGTSDNYAVVESLLLQAGFTNVKTIPLNDLTFGVLKKVGSIDMITINGKELSSYYRRKFQSDAAILITYHSLRS